MFILAFHPTSMRGWLPSVMKCLDQHFHLQKSLMFFIGQGLLALAFLFAEQDVGRSFRRFLNPVAQPCSS